MTTAVKEPPATSGAGVEHYHFLIGGEQAEAKDGRRIDMLCPSDGKVFATIPRGQAGDIDRAVRSAREAFESGVWSRMAPADRGRVLVRLSGLIAAHHEELSQLDARDVGKTIKQARGDVTVLVRYFEYYGGAADKFGGETIPLPSGLTALTTREPHGVVGAILPWNSPTQMIGRTGGPALAMGNAMVVKPAEDACLSILKIAQLALEAGVPRGILNIVTGLGTEAGAALAAHPGVDFVTFTGSPQVGAMVQKAAADHHAAVTLELGGKSPQILFADANLEAALPIITSAITVNSGQTCVAGSRLLVQRSAWDAVVDAFAKRFKALEAGPYDGEYDFGALINAKQLRRVSGFLERASADHVPELARGRIAPAAAPDGFYVPSVSSLPTTPNTAWAPASGRATSGAPSGWRAASVRARCSSTATAPAAGSSFRSAASRNRGMAARRGWKPCANSRRPRPSSSTMPDGPAPPG
jgi:aldehyde dehydrogenase (NAD+)